MSGNIQNFDNRNNGYAMQLRVASSAVKPQIQSVRIPDYYVPDDRKSFKEVLEENPMYSMGIKGFFGPLIEHPVASVLTWFGCGFLLDKYTSSCGGEYNRSLLKKVTNFGDKIEKSGFVQSKPIQSILGLFKKGGEKSGNIIQKNSVLRAIWKTPTMPEWELVKSEMIPQRQRVVHDFNHIVSELKLAEDKGFAALNKLALNKEEKNLLKTLAGKLNTEEKASSYIQLKRLGKTDSEIMNIISKPDGGVAATKQAILKALGHDEAWIKAVKEDTIGKKILEVQEATKRVGGKVKIGLGDFRFFGKDLGILSTPTKRVLACDNVYNRLRSLDPANGATKTGRFMSRFMQMVHRGLTFGGGKLGVLLFIAPAFVETAINVHKAEPDQKIGTGVSNLVNHISWVFTFPFALQIMHHICGAQYAGMKPEKVQELRKLQSEFNKRNKDGEFKTYKEYNNARIDYNKKMKQYKIVEGQKWYTKGIRKLADMITPDLGKLDGYKTGNFVTTKLHQLRNLPRNAWGVPVRLVLFGVLTMGVLDTILNKGIKLIFGDSYDSMKEEEIKDAKKEQKKFLKEDLTDRLYEAQRRKITYRNNSVKNQQTLKQNNVISHHGAPQVTQTGYNNSYETILNQEIADSYSYIPKQDNKIKSEIAKGKTDSYTYIPSQNSVIQKKNNENNSNVRTYIPSQLAANITKTWDNSGLQNALNRADRAEQRALKVLGGNFEGM